MARASDIRTYRPAFFGMGLMACLLFLVLAATPAYGVLATVLLSVLWLVLFVLACGWFTRRPRWVPVVACLGLLAWLGTVALASL